MSVQQCVCLLGAASECPTHGTPACACLDGEWNPVCRVHPPKSDALTCVCPPGGGGYCPVHNPKPTRTPLRYPQKVSHADFDRAMRLLKADRSAEGLHLISLHIENGKIEATYAEVHQIGLVAEVTG